MMNEFIVWDEENKCFVNMNMLYDIDFYSKQVNYFYLEEIAESEFEENSVCTSNFSICNYIGKTDIEGNKIFADSSIVEMDIYDEDGEHLHIGYFRYNDSLLLYEFIEKADSFGVKNIWRMEKLQTYSVNLKIIGTLQQDKELLK